MVGSAPDKHQQTEGEMRQQKKKNSREEKDRGKLFCLVPLATVAQVALECVFIFLCQRLNNKCNSPQITALKRQPDFSGVTQSTKTSSCRMKLKMKIKSV